jgi:HSP20 family protein
MREINPMADKVSNVDVKNGGDGSESNRMQALGAYAPWTSLRGELDRVVNRFFPEGWPYVNAGSLMDFEPMRSLSRVGLGGMVESARADISESDSKYEISVELPGIDEKDIELGISDGVLTLKAEKRDEREEKKKDYHLTERSYGSVRRSFRVPEGVDTDKIKAAFSKGVLEVTLPKSKKAKASQRRISVNAS